MASEKDLLASSKFTINELLAISDKGDDMTVRERIYLDKRISNLYNYRGSIGNELELTPDEEQLKFIKMFLPYLINNCNTRINQIMKVYSLDTEMVFLDSIGQDLLGKK